MSHAAQRKPPYTIERYRTIPGTVLLIGYDGRGEVMIELRMPERRFTDRTVSRMRAWLMANDDARPTMEILR